MTELEKLVLRYKSPVFTATVLDDGDVLQMAVNAGYLYIVGASTSEVDVNRCRERFAGMPNVRLFYGEDIVLNEVIRDINVAVTFCLDTRSEPAPALLQELGILKHHRIKSHTLLIRNLGLLGTEASGFITLDQVRSVVQTVNNLYRYRTEGDTLVCSLQL